MREAYLARSLTVCAAPATLSRISSLTALPATSTTLSLRLLSISR